MIRGRFWTILDGNGNELMRHIGYTPMPQQKKGGFRIKNHRFISTKKIGSSKYRIGFECFKCDKDTYMVME